MTEDSDHSLPNSDKWTEEYESKVDTDGETEARGGIPTAAYELKVCTKEGGREFVLSYEPDDAGDIEISDIWSAEPLKRPQDLLERMEELQHSDIEPIHAWFELKQELEEEVWELE